MGKILKTLWDNPLAFVMGGLFIAALVLITSGSVSLRSEKDAGTSAPQSESDASINRSNGMLLGIVRGADNAAVPGATVRAINTVSAKITETVSDTGGSYQMFLPSGQYIVVAQKEGFETSLVTNVTVSSAVNQDMTLTPSGRTAIPVEENNPDNYILRNGVNSGQYAKTLLIAQGGDPKKIKRVSETAFTGEANVQYRDGQALAMKKGYLSGEPAWKVEYTDDTPPMYIQKKCGNMVMPAQPEPPKVIYVTPPPPPVVSQPILRSFTVTVIATANAIATAKCPDGTRAEAISSGRGEVTVTASTYDEAYAKAADEARKQAEKAAEANAKASVTCAAPSTPPPPPPPPPPSTKTATPRPVTPPPTKTATPKPTTPTPTKTATPTPTPCACPTVPPTQPPTPPPPPPPPPTPPPTPVTPPPPTPEATLIVKLRAEPDSGFAPLLAVTPVVIVEGTATGLITYNLDCGNGTMRRTIVTDSTTWRADRLCDYLQPGEYDIRVSVERMNLSVAGNSTVIVASP